MARQPTRRPRRREPTIAFDAITIEGALLQPETVTRIASADPNQQLALDYGLDPGEKLREVVQTKFTIAQSLHARFQGSDKGAAALKRFLTSLFTQVFEFADLAETDPIVSGDRVFPIGHQALGGRLPLVFAPFAAIDKGAKAFGDAARQRAPAQLLQEYLNAEDNALWGIVADGQTLRLYRDNAAMTRPAYIGTDLAMLFDSEAPRLADFSALWLLIHASRFGNPSTPPSDSALERWREEGRAKGARARDELRGGVEEALSLLGQGFLAHPANAKLKDDVAKGALSPQGYLDALLRLVYRLIFVFAAEDRDLLHLPQPHDASEFESWRLARDLYKRGYGLDRLRSLSAKRHAWDRNTDGWEGTKILFRELWRGQPNLALPALGGLFEPGEVRDFSDCQIANQFFYGAIFHLAWLRTASGIERVNWRDMETEELGSVYESLLELTPDLSGPTGFAFVDVAGHERKTTASYYTPDSLVQALLNEVLDPLIVERIKGKDGNAAIEALLNLRIIDPACGSGHFLLAAARRLAVKCAQLDKPGGAPSPADYRHWLREVARRSLFGVDKNPMAIELAKVALWVETVEPGKPLSFLDAHLRCGDALLGVYDLGALNRGIPDEAYTPLTGDVKAVAAEWRKRNKAERDARKLGEFALLEPPRDVLVAVRALEAQGEDALAEVEAKGERFRAMLAGPDRYRMEVACNLYCAAFLLPKTLPPARLTGDHPSFIPTSRDVWDKLADQRPPGPLEGQAVDAAKAARAFHWHLEFPQVFFPETGQRPGFDLALGNPPWDQIQLDPAEWFASRAPNIADAQHMAARHDLILALKTENAPLWSAYDLAVRQIHCTQEFIRSSGRFPTSRFGRLNTAPCFAELIDDLTLNGWAGIIVPSSLVTDSFNQELFKKLFERRLQSLYSFKEIRQWFTATDDRNPFCLLTLSRSKVAASFAFSLDDVGQIKDPERRFALSLSDVELINPNTRTAAVFRSRADADLTKQIYRHAPILIAKDGHNETSAWGAEFQLMFMMSTGSRIFRTAEELSNAGLRREHRDWVTNDLSARFIPLYEAKMVHHYDHRWSTYEPGTAEFRSLALNEKCDSSLDVSPRYWVPETEVAERLLSKHWARGWLIGWRDICRAADERTMIASAIPRSAVGNTLPLIFPNVEPKLCAALLAVLSSLPFDYVVRQKIGGTHLTFGYVNQLPCPAPSLFSETDLGFIVSRVLELTFTSETMKPFADDLGFEGPPFVWDEQGRALLRAELDAKIARLYGLTRDQLRYILDPTDIYGPTYPSETFRVLKKNEIAKFGEYRTARLVLDAWDRMESGEL